MQNSDDVTASPDPGRSAASDVNNNPAASGSSTNKRTANETIAPASEAKRSRSIPAQEVPPLATTPPPTPSVPDHNQVRQAVNFFVDMFGDEHREYIQQRLHWVNQGASLEALSAELVDELGSAAEAETAAATFESDGRGRDTPNEYSAASATTSVTATATSTTEIELGPHVDRTVAALLTAEQKEAAMNVQEMFPEADPNHIVQRIVQVNTDALVEEMATRAYPTLRDRLEKERLRNRRLEYEDPALFNVVEYLRMFNNDPTAYWRDQTKQMSQLYIQHAQTFLSNRYSNMAIPFLNEVLHHFNQHLLPAVELIDGPNARGVPSTTRRRTVVPFRWTHPQFIQTRRLQAREMPEQIDETFYRELQYIQHTQLIHTLLVNRNAERARRVEEAKQNQALVECAICASDVLPEEMVACDGVGAHSFCTQCVQQHAHTQVADEGVNSVLCMDADCKVDYSIGQLRALLSAELVDKMIKRSQQAELHQAALPNLYECPSCDFAIIIDNPDEKVFRCQNPGCFKETCRECKKPSHLPYSCAEMNDSDAVTRMRVYIEDEMANALSRLCPGCNKRILKTEGCNHMRCKCGQQFCYGCGLPLHNHKYNPKCQLTANAQHVKAAGESAKAQYLKDNPDAAQAVQTVQLNVDQLLEDGQALAP